MRKSRNSILISIDQGKGLVSLETEHRRDLTYRRAPHLFEEEKKKKMGSLDTSGSKIGKILAFNVGNEKVSLSSMSE